MTYRNPFAQLSNEAVEHAAQNVLSQLTERLNFAKRHTRNDEEIECLQFGICSYEPQPQRVTL